MRFPKENFVCLCLAIHVNENFRPYTWSNPFWSRRGPELRDLAESLRQNRILLGLQS